MLDLTKLFILTLQLLLVDPIALHLCQGALVIEMVHRAVDFGAEIMVVLKELELVRGVSAEVLRLDFTHMQTHWTASLLFSLPHTEAHVQYDLEPGLRTI